MPMIREAVNAEIRIVYIDEVRLVEGPAIDQCFREVMEALDKSEESGAVLHFGRVTFMSSAALGPRWFAFTRNAKSTKSP